VFGARERWVGSTRREVLDHIIPLNEQHLRRLGRDYLAYYHDDRTHIGLEKTTTAAGRLSHARPERLTSSPCLESAGLHHRYTWSAAA
jgi:hypothetical protein